MNKKVIIPIICVTIVIVIIVVSYFITISIDKDKKENKIGDTVAEEKNIDEEKTVEKSNDEYKNINIDSTLATELFNFAPKHFQTITNKMTNEYYIYSAISNLEKQNVKTSEYETSYGVFPGYKYSLVEAEVKKIFGEHMSIIKKDKYELIGYIEKDDIFYKIPFGFGNQEETQTIKSLRENNKTFILEIYAVNIEYDVEDLNHVYISTKETFKLHEKNETDIDKIKSTMIKYSVNGIEVEPTSIAKIYKNDLPIIEYTIEKIDERGTKYFVKDIKYLLN